MKTAALVLAGIVLIVLIGGVVVYAGWYNIAASEPHAAWERRLLDTTKQASVRRHAADVVVPPLDQPEEMLAGAGPYADMCAPCHGAPGVERTAMGRGLNPLPPAPEDMVPAWTPAEMFWITKHGIRMTGMPAWGESHSDEEIWQIVAFVRQIPEMSPQTYAAWVEKSEHEHDHEHGDTGQTHEHERGASRHR
jgi:mono/diheme cytochrome c family protein